MVLGFVAFAEEPLLPPKYTEPRRIETRLRVHQKRPARYDPLAGLKPASTG